MVLTILQGEGALCNCRYVVIRIQCTLATSVVWTQTEWYAEFSSLKGGLDRKQRPKAARSVWISKKTWYLVDRRSKIEGRESEHK